MTMGILRARAARHTGVTNDGKRLSIRTASTSLTSSARRHWLLPPSRSSVGCSLAYFSSRVSTVQSKMSDAINRAEHAREGMAADLQDLQKALGSLTEVLKQAEEAKIALSKATAARAASQNELTDLNKQISDARLAVSGAQEQASARARDFQAIDTKGKVAADQLAGLQAKIQTAQNNGKPRQASATRRSRPSPTPKTV